MEWQRGFSLIELLVTLAVVAILLTVGVPASQAFIAKSRLTTASNQFTLSLLLARSEAAKRGKDVLMISANGKDWSGGWRVGVDVNGDGDLSDASDEVVRVAAALRGGVSLKSSQAEKFAISPSGWVTPSATMSVGFNGKNKRIKVLASGRVTLTGD